MASSSWVLVLLIALSYYSQHMTTTAMTTSSSVPSHRPPRKKAIVVIDPVTEWKQVVQAAANIEHQVIAVQMTGIPLPDRMKAFLPSTPTLLQHGVNHIVSMHDGNRDVFSCVQQLQLLAQQYDLEIRGVIPLSELAVDVSDMVAACLGLPHNPLELATSRRDKGFMKQAAARHGLRVAKFARIASVDELKIAISMEEQLELATFPVVVKTPQGFSSTDVYICQSLEQAATAVESIVGNLGPDGRPVRQALLEEYIHGTEFAVNLMASYDSNDSSKDESSSSSSLSKKRLLVTDVWKYQKNEQARYSSAEICNPSDYTYSEIVSYARQVAEAVGIRYGAAHVELKAKKKTNGSSSSCSYVDPVMMEVGARLSGGRKATMTQAAVADWDPFTALIESHCGGGGGGCFLQPQQRNAITTRDFTPGQFVRHIFLPIEQAGRIQDIISLDTIPSLTTLHSSAIIVKVGDVVPKTTDITSCAGFVWLVGERAQVDRETDKVRSTFRVVME